MMEQWTTLEQSKKLAEVWKDAETEKYHFIWLDKWLLGEIISYEPDGDVNLAVKAVKYTKAKDAIFPAFSISDILERLRGAKWIR